ncbi:hypothetical protein AB4371_22565 [Vibrio sp. 10N.261.51.A3]|uniref:hypothetical protein n=1 Tax=Vibrio sp. 10N.261.51.A3 TaxID=3229673 RepID=UPI0035504807
MNAIIGKFKRFYISKVSFFEGRFSINNNVIIRRLVVEVWGVLSFFDNDKVGIRERTKYILGKELNYRRFSINSFIQGIEQNNFTYFERSSMSHIYSDIFDKMIRYFESGEPITICCSRSSVNIVSMVASCYFNKVLIINGHKDYNKKEIYYVLKVFKGINKPQVHVVSINNRDAILELRKFDGITIVTYDEFPFPLFENKIRLLKKCVLPVCKVIGRKTIFVNRYYNNNYLPRLEILFICKKEAFNDLRKVREVLMRRVMSSIEEQPEKWSIWSQKSFYYCSV